MDICPFCEIDESRIIKKDKFCFAVFDEYPVVKHHLLIIPWRHINSFQEMTTEEWQAVFTLTKSLSKSIVMDDTSVEGFNLGINDGVVAGQTIFHAHIHLIPRRQGDVENKCGGVRAVIPGKACYPVRKRPAHDPVD